jgi:acyl-CoA thioesterase
MEPDELALMTARHMYFAEGTGPSFGIEIIAVRVGYAKISMMLQQNMLNGFGSAHGGMIFMLADTAFAYAANSRNVTTVSQHAAITFLAPAHINDLLIAEARELSHGGRTSVYAVTVLTEAGRTIAEFQGVARTLGMPVTSIPDFDFEGKSE